MSKVISLVGVEEKIFYIRRQKVMLSTHLADLYGVEPKVLIQSVKRNIERFPEDFMFQLTWEEAQFLRSHIVTLKPADLRNSRSQIVTLKQGANVKFLPYAFTEQGIAMLSSVLRSKSAIAVNIAIMRAFVSIREVMSSHKELAAQLNELERKVGAHDHQIVAIFDAIRKLMTSPPEKKKRPIGFIVDREEEEL